MLLSKHLKKSNILIKAKAKDRWTLIEELLDLAIKNNEIKAKDRELLKKTLFEREKSITTGIGRGVAIPHCASDVIEDAVIILAFCENDIDFESIDNQPVHIVIFLLVSKNKLKQHVKTLANIAKLMNDEELRNKLLQLKKPEAIIKAIRDAENNSDR